MLDSNLYRALATRTSESFAITSEHAGGQAPLRREKWPVCARGARWLVTAMIRSPRHSNGGRRELEEAHNANEYLAALTEVIRVKRSNAQAVLRNFVKRPPINHSDR